MELMIAIVILAILVTLAFPLYQRTVERSRMSEAYLHLEAIKNAEFAFYNKYNEYSPLLNALIVDNPNDITTADTRYFEYNQGIVLQISPPGFKAQCTRNDKDNALGRNYFIWINQDGQIWSDFYTQ